LYSYVVEEAIAHASDNANQIIIQTQPSFHFVTTGLLLLPSQLPPYKNKAYRYKRLTNECGEISLQETPVDIKILFIKIKCHQNIEEGTIILQLLNFGNLGVKMWTAIT
jgi:hypothetical protein